VGGGGSGGSTTGGAGAGGSASGASGSSGGGAGGNGGTEGNLLQGSGFETATNEGWVARGSGVTAEPSTEYAHTGDYSLKITGRSAVWHGTEYNAAALVSEGTTYRIRAWVRLLDGSAANTLRLTRQLLPTGVCTANEFSWITSLTVTPDAWVELTGLLMLPAGCTPTTLLIYVEAADTMVAYYLDDVFLGIE
jgi:endo-1,4-beta-xylanase